MSITNQFAHDRYERAPEKVRETIDEAAASVMHIFQNHGFQALSFGWDEAENMVAALMVYLEASNPEVR